MDKKNVNVTYGEVSLAAETLLKQGEKPTAKRISESLDATESLPLIANYLAQWETKRNHPELQELPFSSHDTLDTPNLINISNQELEKIIDTRTSELEQSLALVKATLESTADGIMILSNEGKLIDWNQKFVEILKIPKHVLSDRDANAGVQYAFAQVADPEPFFRQIAYLYEHPEASGDMGVAELKDGRFIERYSQPHIVDGKIIGRVWSFRDITKKYKMTSELKLRERAINASSQGIIITDINNRIIYCNPAFEYITGYSKDEAISNDYEVFLNLNKDVSKLNSINLALKEYKSVSFEIKNYKKNGESYWHELDLSPVPDMKGKFSNFVWIINDITLRKKMEFELRHQATHDALTSLPNKTLLLDRVNQAIIHAKRSKGLFALLFIDLDHFKLVNDALGHHHGDLLLIEVAKRIQETLREIDTISRIGGDEFIILIEYLNDEKEVKEVVKKILSNLSKKFVVNENELHITGSIGISFYPKDGTDFGTLYQNADISMYKAKNKGRATYQCYDKKLRKKIEHYMLIESSALRAIEEDEFMLYYQPIIDDRTGEITSLEALIRWQHPKLGFIAPDQFIDILEGTDIIKPLTLWVFERACKDLEQLAQLGKPNVQMSLNMSGRLFTHNKISKDIAKILNSANVNPQRLFVEITERVLVENSSMTFEILDELLQLSLSIVIDDFGTGYSSLNYLRLFNISALKIDRSFVSEISNNPDDKGNALIKAIIAMAHSLDIKVIAEGVETKDQLDFLSTNGCHYFQGYYYYKPMPFKDLKVLLKK